ncbi:MAG: hypothetical protein WDA09_04245 [Bacteriovoracaceae bacterium]
MSTLEKEVIRRYRQVFPHDTLKAISEKTGIQITRVFRIMNGKPMKVKELEVFENILKTQCGGNKSSTEIDRLTKVAVSILSIKDLEQIINLIERKIKNHELKHCPTFSLENEDLIA